MSIIKNLLAKQEAEFISLRDLFNQMASEGGGTPQEAARFLLRQIESVAREPGGWVPAWYKQSETGWNETGARPWEAARVALSQIVKTGDFEEMSDDIPF